MDPMKLSEIEIPSEHLAGLNRLLGKMTASAKTSRENSDLVRRTFGYDVRAGSINEAKRSVRVVASTTAIDSYSELVKQDWDLRRYRANPVVLYAHNAVGLCGPAEDTLPIGYASDVAVVAGRLEATINFVSEKATPMAEMVWRGVLEGSLRAVSVGFRPGKTDTEYLADGSSVEVLSENDLFEISVVPLPANPEAVARSVERNKAQNQRLAAKHDVFAGVPAGLRAEAEAVLGIRKTQPATKTNASKRLSARAFGRVTATAPKGLAAKALARARGK
jgi:HK97 family phage prohead protease